MTETKLKGTSRLIIWDRIASGDILFEGKGLVIENDLFTVAGRANQILQSVTNKSFGPVTLGATDKDLDQLKHKWLDFLSGKPVEAYEPSRYPNAKILEISSPSAIRALIISLQANPRKEQLTKECLKKVYNLKEMPKEKGSPAIFCNPDTYTLSYLGMLFGENKPNEKLDANWWQTFWEANGDKLVWNKEKGHYEVK